MTLRESLVCEESGLVEALRSFTSERIPDGCGPSFAG